MPISCARTRAPEPGSAAGPTPSPEGTIVVAGSVRFRDFFKLAVVGGTEIYDNVRGSLTVTSTRDRPRREILIFRLIV